MEIDNNITVISTGGTISCRPTDRGLSPALSAEEMLDISGVDASNIACVDLFSMDSSNVQPEEWLEIAAAIEEKAKSGKTQGVVLIHGTDTMAYTAAMLSYLLLNINIPVVLTGAQLPIEAKGSDGTQNLTDAITAVRRLSPGVYICFGGSVMLGCRAVKTHTISRHAFESINRPYIARIEEGRFTLVSEPPKRNNTIEGLTMNLCPDVALIKLIPGTSPMLLESVLKCNIKGLVVESFGLGGVHSIRRDHNEALIKLMENGVTVVLTSQCLYEAASLNVYEVSRTLRDAGAISAADMTTEAAVTKLMWVLGQRNTPEEIRDLLLTNVCGDCES